MTLVNIWYCWPYSLTSLAFPHSTFIIWHQATPSHLFYFFTLLLILLYFNPLQFVFNTWFFPFQTFYLDDLNCAHGFNSQCNDEIDSPVPALVPLWLYTWKPLPLEILWISHKNPKFCLPKAEFILSSPIPHIQPILCLLCFLILERHCHPNSCLSQKTINHSSLICCTTNHSLISILNL